MECLRRNDRPTGHITCDWRCCDRISQAADRVNDSSPVLPIDVGCVPRFSLALALALALAVLLCVKKSLLRRGATWYLRRVCSCVSLWVFMQCPIGGLLDFYLPVRLTRSSILPWHFRAVLRYRRYLAGGLALARCARWAHRRSEAGLPPKTAGGRGHETKPQGTARDCEGTAKGLRGLGCRCITPFNAQSRHNFGRGRAESTKGCDKAATFSCSPAFLFWAWPGNACFCHPSISYSHSYL